MDLRRAGMSHHAILHVVRRRGGAPKRGPHSGADVQTTNLPTSGLSAALLVATPPPPRGQKYLIRQFLRPLLEARNLERVDEIEYNLLRFVQDLVETAVLQHFAVVQAKSATVEGAVGGVPQGRIKRLGGHGGDLDGPGIRPPREGPVAALGDYPHRWTTPIRSSG